MLASTLDTPIATGEPLTSVEEHWRLMAADAIDYVQPDAPRIGGVTPFPRVMALSDHKGLSLAPHFAMELHVHLAAVYPRTAWMEHLDWLEPLFYERMEVRGGPTGLGLTLSDQATAWTTDHIEFTETRAPSRAAGSPVAGGAWVGQGQRPCPAARTARPSNQVDRAGLVQYGRANGMSYQ